MPAPDITWFLVLMIRSTSSDGPNCRGYPQHTAHTATMTASGFAHALPCASSYCGISGRPDG